MQEKGVNLLPLKIGVAVMIQLDKITKIYKVAESEVDALQQVSISFREAEFVSILGPSGCGKTTLLNIIGGLDHYTEGDMFIDGVSTKEYKDRDWDTYRNHRVGFVFQSYNLIPHQTILENVELALNIAGVKKDERVARAKKALDKVGLGGLYNKKPNQLSGGQCQRVAIARALVNEPEILLADEPTGALDTETSVQIMDIIKEISKDTLVIMVTHNPDLAEKYSTRIIRLLDGKVISDSKEFNPKIEKVEKVEHTTKSRKSKLGFWSAFRLSARNLWSKIKRTLMVCVAGSIGVIGVASVLAVSTGIQSYINNMQNDMLSGNPITISETALNMSGILSSMDRNSQNEAIKQSVEDGYVNVDKVMDYIIDMAGRVDNLMVQNEIDENYVNYVLQMPKEYYAAFNLDYSINVLNNIYTQSPFTNQEEMQISLQTIRQVYTQILAETNLSEYASLITTLDNPFKKLPSSKEFVLSQYDIIAPNGDLEYPKNKNEIALVVNDDTALSDLTLAQLGYYSQDQFINLIYKALEDERYNEEIDNVTRFSYEDLLGRTFVWYPNDTVYNAGSGLIPFTYNPTVTEGFENGVEFTISCILRPKAGLSYGSLSTGLYYTEELTNYILDTEYNSTIVTLLRKNKKDYFTNIPPQMGADQNSSYAPLEFSFNFIFDSGDGEGPTERTMTGHIGSQSAWSGILSNMPGFGGGSSGGGSSMYNGIYQLSLRELGGEKLPQSISIYPVDFEIKDQLTSYLQKWNEDGDIVILDSIGQQKTLKKEDRQEIQYSDNLGLVISMINDLLSIITTALVAFTSLSLVVSTVMIAIITYVSVIERIKEIGVIRSLGGRKKDVSRLFIAESIIIGGTSGIIGLVITFIITLIINGLADLTIATLTFPISAIMFLISVLLTLISGLIPARAASKKDPVVALRTE